ncbi:hypothetical protein EVAR_99380_1 [Eumeta japonica]|uniref:Uncharacterized protein n=1 Tax=Eumeta variegata TaxID=151549 RepID=A0A4C1YQH0_EUMVA|nr:hypothetical protein EVAR_99380_1 [Eumeta japonica]
MVFNSSKTGAALSRSGRVAKAFVSSQRYQIHLPNEYLSRPHTTRADAPQMQCRSETEQINISPKSMLTKCRLCNALSVHVMCALREIRSPSRLIGHNRVPRCLVWFAPCSDNVGHSDDVIASPLLPPDSRIPRGVVNSVAITQH